MLLDGLADAGQRLDAVAGVEAGGVDVVLEPRAAREPLGAGQRALEAEEEAVEPVLHGALAQARAGRRAGDGDAVGAGALVEPRERVVERREVEVGRGRLAARGDEGLRRVGDQLVGAVVEAAVALGDLLARLVGEARDFADVTRDGLGQRVE